MEGRGSVVAADAVTLDSTGTGVVFDGDTMQAANNVSMKGKTIKIRFILSPISISIMKGR